jgi:transposase-like protein
MSDIKLVDTFYCPVCEAVYSETVVKPSTANLPEYRIKPMSDKYLTECYYCGNKLYKAEEKWQHIPADMYSSDHLKQKENYIRAKYISNDTVDPRKVQLREQIERTETANLDRIYESKGWSWATSYNEKQNIINNTPECPTCHSKNVSKIGFFDRTTSVLALGLFSKKINKSFKCNNCKYTW